MLLGCTLLDTSWVIRQTGRQGPGSMTTASSAARPNLCKQGGAGCAGLPADDHNIVFLKQVEKEG
jgi:hypothetical protein